jgi:cytochrome c556
MQRSIPLLIAAALVTGAAGYAAAQNLAPITQRKALLKEIGDGIGPIGPMLRRERPFDLAVVQASLTVIARNTPQLPALFPPDSRTGGETRALPALFDRKAEVDALFGRLTTAATAARTGITDEATFRAQFPGVLAVCGECHRSFRAAN